jgi:hypothetical protein
LALWERAKPIAGTIAETHLAGRDIDVAQLPANISDTLRFHPRCPFEKTHHPCMLALFRDVETDEPAGILRTALTPEGQKIDRLSLGRWRGVRVIKLWPAGETLIVGEGIETVLAAATQLTHNGEPLRPAWAFGPKGGLERFLPLQGVKHLTILADNDVHGGGQTAARNCAQVWAAAGYTARVLTPNRVKDFNDVVVRKGAV